jgi:hypothetical protein
MFNKKKPNDEDRFAALEQQIKEKNDQIEKLLANPVVAVALKQAEIAAAKQAELDRMTAHGLNYDIIRELVNSAVHGVEVNIRFTTGEVLTIARTESYQKMVDQFRSDTF